MSVGTYLSGTGHAALVVWMVAGWGMASEPLPFEVTEVSVVSGAEFAAMTQGVQPELPPSEPATIETPEIEDAPPAVSEEAPPEVPDAPTPVEQPTPETPPEAPELTVPDTVVTDAPPEVPDTPQIVTAPQSAEIGTSLRPVPRPAPRVAPEIIAPPEPDATVAPDVTQAATEEVEAPVEEDLDPADETTAPEAAADQIVTEAEEPSFAPEVSSRPQTRPQRAAPAAETPSEDAIDPVAAALAEAGAADTPAPTATPNLSGGQLSEGQTAGFLRQVGSCWNVGSMSSAAQQTIIVMTFDMSENGKPISGSESLEGFEGGSRSDAEVVYRAARSALFRCTGDGYELPVDQYALWQRIELTVDPTEMRLR